jgi:hypothetical protein
VANTFKFVDWIGQESLRILVNRLAIADGFNTSYNKEYKKDFAVGETVRIPYPVRGVIRDGFTYQEQPVDVRNTTITVDQPFGMDFGYDSIEQALKMGNGEGWIKDTILDPYMSQIAQEMDSRASLFAYQRTNNVVGSLKTTPTDTTLAGAARQRMIENACPPAEYKMVMTPAAMTSIVNGTLTQFNPQDAISKAFKEGYYGSARGFTWFESMSLYTHTAGNWQTPAANTISGSGQSGTSLLVNCTSGDTFKAGDVFNIAAVNNVNPSTRRSTGTLRQFRITQDATATGSTITLQISGGDGQGIVGPGDQYQNVDALPLTTALMTLFPGTTLPSASTGTQGLAFSKDAFAMVGVNLMMPKAVEMSVMKRDPKTGIAISLIRAFDPTQRRMVNRFDTLIGFGELYSNACSVRVLSST